MSLTFFLKKYSHTHTGQCALLTDILIIIIINNDNNGVLLK